MDVCRPVASGSAPEGDTQDIKHRGKFTVYWLSTFKCMVMAQNLHLPPGNSQFRLQLVSCHFNLSFLLATLVGN